MDEMNTVARVIDKGPAVVLAFSSEGNNHLMNTVLMYVSKVLFGETEWVLRLPVLLLGALTPVAIYARLRRLVPDGAALTAAVLAIVHFRYVEFSANARGYAGVILFSTLACCLFAELQIAFRWRLAIAYALTAAGTAAFVPTTLYVAAAHALVAAFALVKSRWAARQWAILGACVWAGVIGISANSLLIPQLLDYARHGSAQAHKLMGLELLKGIAFFMAGTSHLWLACLMLLLSGIGLVRYRSVPWLNAALLAPMALYLFSVTALGQRTSPRMYVQFIFPCIAGFALFLYSEWTRRPVFWQRGLASAVLAACVVDSLPQFERFYEVSNPALKQLAGRLSGSPVMLIGDQADLNGYYFHGALAIFGRESDRLAERILEARPQYLVGGMDCVQMARGGGFIEISRKLGYRPQEELVDWTYGEQAGPSERQPCFMVLKRP
jgi:hypothetical protein